MRDGEMLVTAVDAAFDRDAITRETREEGVSDSEAAGGESAAGDVVVEVAATAALTVPRFFAAAITAREAKPGTVAFFCFGGMI